MVGGHVGGAPAQLGGRGDGVGGDAVEIPNEAGVGGATGVEGLVGHRRLDPSPSGQSSGLFCPRGSVPATASDDKLLPSPDRYT
uniref:DUF834 domain-containing protein n=1 Tax=Oryza meridionalis TaxID=40149 RepID=A0A0E0DVF1_9ORYZ